MNPKSKWRAGIAVGLLALAATGLTMANTVNVDIQGATAGGPGFNLNIGTYAGTAAALSTGTTWNAFQFNNTYNASILDEQGVATDVGIWLQGNPGEWSYNNANTLMGDYTFLNTNWSNNAGGRFTIFSNHADGGTGMQLDGSKTYDIYIYTMGDAAGQYTTFQLNHAGGTTNQTATGDGPFGGTFTEGANYLKFSNVTPKAYNVSGTDNGFEFEFWWGRAAGNTTAAALNGFQIVETDVPAIPTFVNEPDDYSGFVGDTVTLTAQAIGAPTLTYQWQYSADEFGVWGDISGATSSTLQIVAAQLSDNGYYRVVAANGNGATPSAVAQVTLVYPDPTITSQPQSIAVYEGSEVVLRVAATTIGTPEYQWFKGASGDTSNPIISANSDTLTFASIQISDAGDYWVRVTDPGHPTANSTDSDTATVQVSFVPEVVGVQVDIQGVGAGGPGFNLNIGTYADIAAAPLTGTSWNAFPFNNTLSPNLVDDHGVATDVQVWLQGNPGEWSYANDNSLMGDYTFTNTDWANNGGEKFTISSNHADGGTGMQLDGSKTYDIYIYTMGDAAGQYTTFQLNHAGGTTNQTATGDGPFGGTFTEGANYLKFSNVTPKAYNISGTENGFEFEFWWGRAAGNTTTTAAINGIQIVETDVPAIPTFVSEPANYNGTVGDTVTLSAQAIAAPAPTYQWQYSADGVNGWADISGATSSTLQIVSAQYSDNGYYLVVATNDFGPTTSAVAQVALVYPNPTITSQPQSTSRYEGGALDLTVTATTLGTAEYQWYKGVSGDTSNPVFGANSDTLSFASIQISDAGDYWVRVTDPAALNDGQPATFTDSDASTVQVLPAREGVVVLVDFDAVAGGQSGPATSADFTAQGVPTLTAADPVHVSAPQPVNTAVTTVNLTDGLTMTFADDDAVGGCNGAFSVNNGSALLNDYVYLQEGTEGDGPTTVTVSGLNLESNAIYTLYVFGSGEGAGQVSVFTPVDSTNIAFQSTSPVSGNLVVTFTTGAGYAGDDLVFQWARDTGSAFAALNGMAIVPGELAADDYAAWIADYPGVGALSGFNDDADGDGLSNGVENLLGTDPSVSNQGIVGVAKSGSTITFQHPQNASPAIDVTAGYRWSTDLVSFHNDGAASGGTTVTFAPALDTPVAGTTTVTATITGTVPAKLFVVLGATKNP